MGRVLHERISMGTVSRIGWRTIANDAKKAVSMMVYQCDLDSVMYTVAIGCVAQLDDRARNVAMSVITTFTAMVDATRSTST
ncbi:hypothetical protein KIN20_024636 [Parelaphostrongylus tenuis]|uniref:Uncharacterized protein n=1 Tax=Parelaphostrongylus tenuis TaxID=148309 RepID=A0AAD5MTR5_PARTN|nr:hypothetical protein KIN20_024636 [Parelaphostrongylus tenuis]